MTDKETTGEDLTFEQALGQLETLATRMERGDLSLDEAIESFEKGIGLARSCKSKLDAAEGKIQKLTEDNRLEDFLAVGEGD